MEALAKPWWYKLSVTERNVYIERANPVRNYWAATNKALEEELQRIICAYENTKKQKLLTSEPKISVTKKSFGASSYASEIKKDNSRQEKKESKRLVLNPMALKKSASNHEEMRKNVLRVLEYADAFQGNANDTFLLKTLNT